MIAASHAAIPFKHTFLFSLSLLASVLASLYSSHIELPSKNHPILLYANQDGCDLKALYLRALGKAKKEIFLLIYGLADEEVIHLLKNQYKRGVKVGIYYDVGGSKKLDRYLPSQILSPLKSSGLMHKKALCVDNIYTYLGSANLTETSLRLHDNLAIGFYDKGLIRYLKAPLEPFHVIESKEQKAEVWSLPHPEQGALEKIITLIDSSESSIQICMFTFTHQGICAALQRALNRGVKVEVALDGYAAEGSSKAVAGSLQAMGITLLKAKKGKLLHHKWCLIDQEVLIMGSTNWTKAAFQKNDDTLIFLQPLTKKQLKTIKNIWDKTVKNS